MTLPKGMPRRAGRLSTLLLLAVLPDATAVQAENGDVSIEKLVDLGRLPEARARLSGLQGARALVVEAMILLREGRHDESLGRARECLNLEPQNANAHKLVALNLVALGRKSEAGAFLREAARLDPKDFMAHYYLGMHLLGIRLTESAEASFTEAVRLNPGYPDAHTMLGLTCEQLGKDSEALKHYRTGVELIRAAGVRKESSLLYLGRFLAGRKAYAEARPVLEEAVQLNRGSLEAWQLLGRACMSLSEFGCAVDALKKAVAIDPGEKRNYYFLMQTWQRMGRPEDARRAQKQYEQLSVLEVADQERRVMRGRSPEK